MSDFLNTYGTDNPTINLVVLTLISLLIGLLIRYIFFRSLILINTGKDSFIFKKLENRFQGSIFLFIPMMIIHSLLPSFGFEVSVEKNLEIITETLIIVSFTVISVRLLFFIQDLLFRAYDADKADNHRERQVLTQIVFIRKVVMFIFAVIGLSLILLQFEGVKKYGATILTSAGLAGIVVGFAAQKTIANLLAGLQIAFTQPIKLNDALIVEDEWGWVEEINLTYVVLKIWDRRRLILPITYFTEKPFQNWTRNSADITGSVFLYTDYSVPIEDLRKAFSDFLDQTPLWDREAQILQVTDCTEKTMKIRLLMTAKDSPTAWDLRCFIREKMLIYIQENYPDALPKTRMVLQRS